MKFFKYLICLELTLAIIFSFNLIGFAESTTYVWSNNSETVQTTTTDTENNSNSLNLESGSAILIEQTTGQVLYSHNIHEQLRPASVTKIMSILLIMEQIHNR